MPVLPSSHNFLGYLHPVPLTFIQILKINKMVYLIEKKTKHILRNNKKMAQKDVVSYNFALIY